MRRLPFLLTPSAKDYLWGGNRLNDEFNKGIELSPLAETWECSTHVDGESTVGGVLLSEILTKHPDWLGTHPLQTMRGEAVLPIMIKLIDAKQNLSLQVHPDDAYAAYVEHSLGKTEMWYVLDAKPNSKVIYGFREDMTEERVREAILNGQITRFLNNVSVEKNQLFVIEPGTIHAIGAGCLIAEIQESSNITYRMYDYNRLDKEGKMRKLHIDKAMEVVNLKSSSEPRQPMRVLKYRPGFATELLYTCKYFRVEREILNTEVHRKLVDYHTDDNSFHALLCIDGCGSIIAEQFSMNFFKGDCIFVPADSECVKIHGKAQILDVSC